MGETRAGERLKLSSDTTNDSPEYSLTHFIENNYHLITISGLFAAIAVYLTQLSQQLPVEAQYGIAGSLLVFLLLMLVVIHNGFETASIALSDGAYSHFAAITVVTVGISALVYSAITISTEYADEITPILDIAVTLISASIYIAYLGNDFLKCSPENMAQWLVRASPLIALGILYHFFPVESKLDSMAVGNLSSSLIPGIVLHLMLIFLVLLIIDIFATALDKEELLKDEPRSE